MAPERLISFDDMDTSTGHVSVTSVKNEFPFSNMRALYDYLTEQNNILSGYKYGDELKCVWWMTPDFSGDDEDFGFELQIIPEEEDCWYYGDPEETLDAIEAWVDDLLSDPDRQLDWLEDDIRHGPYTTEEYKEKYIIEPAKYMKIILNKIRDYTEGRTSTLDINWNKSLNESTQNIIVFDDDEDTSVGFVDMTGETLIGPFKTPDEYVYDFLEPLFEEVIGDDFDGVWDEEVDDDEPDYVGKAYHFCFTDCENDDVYFEHFDTDNDYSRFVDEFQVSVDDFIENLYPNYEGYVSPETDKGVKLLKEVADSTYANNGLINVAPKYKKMLNESMSLVTFDDEDTSTGHVDVGSYETEVPAVTDVLNDFAEDFKNYGVNVSDTEKLTFYYTIYFLNWGRAFITFFCDDTDEPFEFMSSVKEFIDMESGKAQEEMVHCYRGYISIDEVEQIQDTVRLVYEDILKKYPMLRRLNENVQGVRMFTFDDEDTSTGYVNMTSDVLSEKFDDINAFVNYIENNMIDMGLIDEELEVSEDWDENDDIMGCTYTIHFCDDNSSQIDFMMTNEQEEGDYKGFVNNFKDSIKGWEDVFYDLHPQWMTPEVERGLKYLKHIADNLYVSQDNKIALRNPIHESVGPNSMLLSFDDEDTPDTSTGYVSVGSGDVSRPVNGVRFLCWLKENTTDTNRPVEDMFEIGDDLDVELFELDDYAEDPDDFDFGEEDPDFDKTYTKEVERNEWFGDGGIEVICREHFLPKYYNADVQDIIINLPIDNDTSFDDFRKWVKNFDPEIECEKYMNKQGWEEDPDSHHYILDYMVEEWERENGADIPEDVYDDLSDKAWQQVYDDFDDEVRKPCLDAFEGIKQCGESLVKEYIKYCQGLEPNKRRGLENEE